MPIQVSAFMSKPVITLTPASTLREAIEKMEHHGVRHFPVGEGTKLLGIVSDRDVYKSLPAITAAHNVSIAQTLDSVTAEMVMAAVPLTVGPDDSVLTAAKVFATRRIGCVPVVDAETGHIVGIVTPRDVLRAIARSGALAQA